MSQLSDPPPPLPSPTPSTTPSTPPAPSPTPSPIPAPIPAHAPPSRRSRSAGRARPGGRPGRKVLGLVGAGSAAAVVLVLVVALVAGLPPFRGDEDPQGAPPSGPAATVAGSVVGGWYAGASGLGVADGEFERWLGQPVTVAATWADQDATAQRTLPTLTKEYKDWKGALDLAVGGTVLGSEENYAAAARGDYDERWREAAGRLAEARKDAVGPTFVRPFHEMNGTWYENWTVTKENSADFKTAFARYARILREAMPSVYISWSPNYGDHTGLNVDYWYPGGDVIDCIAPDYYDDGDSQARVDVDAWNAEADDVDDQGSPVGPEAWRRFAQERGKPVCFPEWGLKPEGDGIDHPEWVRAVNLWMAAHANTATWTLGEPIPAAAAGKVLYSAYFNVVHEGDEGFTIHGTGANPRTAALYPTLTWGNRR